MNEIACKTSIIQLKLECLLSLFQSVFCCLHHNRLFSQIPVINDDLPFKILSGSVLVKPNLKEIRGSTVVFDDGSAVDNVRKLSLNHFICKYFCF